MGILKWLIRFFAIALLALWCPAWGWWGGLSQVTYWVWGIISIMVLGTVFGMTDDIYEGK